jgi:U3 small nucleolar RNA-associated protein 25
MAIDGGNEATTQLLTLLNVSATKAGKRKWILDDTKPAEKLNKRRNVQFGEVHVNEQEISSGEQPKEAAIEGIVMDDYTEENEPEGEEEASQGELYLS